MTRTPFLTGFVLFALLHGHLAVVSGNGFSFGPLLKTGDIVIDGVLDEGYPAEGDAEYPYAYWIQVEELWGHVPGRVRFAADRRYLYLYAEVADLAGKNYHFIEVILWGDGPATAQFYVARPYFWGSSPPYFEEPVDPDVFLLYHTKVDQGAVLEMAIPWSALGFDLNRGPFWIQLVCGPEFSQTGFLVLRAEINSDFFRRGPTFEPVEHKLQFGPAGGVAEVTLRHLLDPRLGPPLIDSGGWPDWVRAQVVSVEGDSVRVEIRCDPLESGYDRLASLYFDGIFVEATWQDYRLAAEALVSQAGPAGPHPWGQLEERPEGQQHSSWFGIFTPLEDGWIYHPCHGFLWIFPVVVEHEPPGSGRKAVIFAFSPFLKRWVYLDREVYPFLYLFGDPGAGWYFLWRGPYVPYPNPLEYPPSGPCPALYFDFGQAWDWREAESLALP